MSLIKNPYSLDEELKQVNKAKEDLQQFAPLYDAYFKPVFLFVRKRIGNNDAAADLTQQVFLKAMGAIKGYTYKGVPFSAWIFRIAMNEINMIYRKTKYTEVEVREKDAFEMMNEMGEPHDEKKLAACLQKIQKLPADQSTIVEMRFFDQMSFAEIGKILGITEANAKMKLYRILEKLKSELQNQND